MKVKEMLKTLIVTFVFMVNFYSGLNKSEYNFSKSFKKQEHIKQHMKHVYCNQGFYENFGLKIHEEWVHDEGKRNFKCEKCTKLGDKLVN